eukprot:353376-Chlamydomonas_euryale.AAC.1
MTHHTSRMVSQSITHHARSHVGSLRTRTRTARRMFCAAPKPVSPSPMIGKPGSQADAMEQHARPWGRRG